MTTTEAYLQTWTEARTTQRETILSIGAFLQNLVAVLRWSLNSTSAENYLYSAMEYFSRASLLKHRNTARPYFCRPV